jgi:hypothetical protein
MSYLSFYIAGGSFILNVLTNRLKDYFENYVAHPQQCPMNQTISIHTDLLINFILFTISFSLVVV